MSKFKYLNAGDLFSRNDKLNLLIAEIDNDIDDALGNQDYLVGKRDAVFDAKSKSHLHLVKELAEAKESIERYKDLEYLSFETDYLLGYYDGLLAAINADREVFEENREFLLFILATNEDIFNKYTLALELNNNMFAFPSGNGTQYFITKSEETLVDTVKSLDQDVDYIINVVYDNESLPDVNLLKQISDGINGRIFLTKDNRSAESIERIISKLIKTTNI